MEEKVVLGKARKDEDVKRFYEIASAKVDSKGRLTEQGKGFIGIINEILDGVGIEYVGLQKVVQYMIEVGEKDESEKQQLVKALRAFLKTNAGKEAFETFKVNNNTMIRKWG
jgi:hypothetical protein